MRPIPNYGYVMTVKEFVQRVKNGLFTNDDGSGYYGTATKMDDDHPVDCRNIYRTGQTDLGFTHVVWFNK